jgi:hypothetical protein
VTVTPGPVLSHLVPLNPQPGMQPQPYPVAYLPKPADRVENRSVRWLYHNMAEAWPILAAGGYIRLLTMGGHAGTWPPAERGWLSLARPPDVSDSKLLKMSVGMFRECLFTCVEEARLCGTVFEVHYGAAGWHREGTTHRPGQVVAHMRYARPAALEDAELPVRVRTWNGEWKVVQD